MKVLDLGCGLGTPNAARFGISDSDDIVGVDLDLQRLVGGGSRKRLAARGEELPFAENSFDVVISAVALPYMDIPRSLREIARVLKPGGRFVGTLHPPSFTLAEFKQCLKVVPAMFRLYVFLDGILFHITGRTVRFPFNNRVESFQTRRGTTIALKRAGMTEISFSGNKGYLGVTAYREGALDTTEKAA